MNVGPYLFFKANCLEAMKFYESCFGGELFVMTYKDAQKEKCPPGYEKQVMHAALKKGDFVVLASDVSPGMTSVPGSAVALSVNCDSEADVGRLFELLSSGGKIHQAPHDAFWGARFASFQDRFGFGWMLNFDRPKKS